MRIAVTAVQPGLDAEVDPRFGRCPYFVIVDTDDLSFESLENPNQALGQGAGIQAARLMHERGVRYVLTGNCGPNAHQALSAAWIGVAVGCSGTVRQVVEQFNAGQLRPAAAANVPGNRGRGQAQATAPGAGTAGTGPPSTPPAPVGGQRRGMGRGGGTGCGMGRGRGQGGGRGQGRGRGCAGS